MKITSEHDFFHFLNRWEWNQSIIELITKFNRPLLYICTTLCCDYSFLIIILPIEFVVQCNETITVNLSFEISQTRPDSASLQFISHSLVMIFYFSIECTLFVFFIYYYSLSSFSVLLIPLFFINSNVSELIVYLICQSVHTRYICSFHYFIEKKTVGIY